MTRRPFSILGPPVGRQCATAKSGAPSYWVLAK